MVLSGPRSRFEPPRRDDRHILRPRLLADVSRRWEARLTLLVAGAGGGKTSLLAQAISENRLAPMGTDHWLSCGLPHNDPARLVRDIGLALGLPNASTEIGELLEALYGFAGPHALHLDDLHRLDTDEALEVVAALLRDAPPNMHLVLATRHEPKLPLSRLEAQGQIVRVDAGEFAYDEEESRQVSERLQTETDTIDSVGGWPALAALQAQTGSDGPPQFLLEEILQNLDADDREELAILVAMGGANPVEMRAALDRPSRVAKLAGTVPLLHSRSDGTVVAHDLWSELGATLGTGLGTELDADSVRVRAARVVAANGDFDRGFDLLINSSDPGRAAEVVVRAVIYSAEAPSTVSLRSWRARLCETLGEGPVVGLLDGMIAFSQDDVGEATRDHFLVAAEDARAEELFNVEVAALIMGILATQVRNETALRVPLIIRLSELSNGGQATAGSSTAVAEAAIAMMADDDQGALACLDRLGPNELPTQWMALVEALRVQAMLMLGMGDEAMEAAIRHGEIGSGDGRAAVLMPRFFAGVTPELITLLRTIDDHGISVVGHQITECHAELVQAWCGRPPPETGRRTQAFGDADAPELMVMLAQARAVDLIGDGKPGQAQSLLESELSAAPERTAWRCVRRVPGLSSVLFETWRERLVEADLPDRMAQDLRQGMNLVAMRAGRTVPAADWAAPPLVWRALPHGLATEAMLRRWAAGDAGAMALAEHLALLAPEATWDLLRSIADSTAAGGGEHTNLAEAAEGFLSSVPAPLLSPVTLCLLGPTELVVGDVAHQPAELQKRKRVRQLLALLGVERSVERSRVLGLLWPDSAESAGAANLRTNLRHLLAAIEPNRRPGEAAFLVRSVGTRLELAGSAYVTTDIELAGEAMDQADTLLASGAPTEAMGRYEDAVNRWRGRPLEELAELGDFGSLAEHVNSRLVAAAVKAAEIRLARGETDRASELASRAIAGDPWSESAHRVSIEAALQRGDRTLAHHLAGECTNMLAEMGVEAATPTAILLRQAGAI